MEPERPTGAPPAQHTQQRKQEELSNLCVVRDPGGSDCAAKALVPARAPPLLLTRFAAATMARLADRAVPPAEGAPGLLALEALKEGRAPWYCRVVPAGARVQHHRPALRERHGG